MRSDLVPSSLSVSCGSLSKVGHFVVSHLRKAIIFFLRNQSFLLNLRTILHLSKKESHFPKYSNPNHCLMKNTTLEAIPKPRGASDRNYLCYRWKMWAEKLFGLYLSIFSNLLIFTLGWEGMIKITEIFNNQLSVIDTSILLSAVENRQFHWRLYWWRDSPRTFVSFKIHKVIANRRWAEQLHYHWCNSNNDISAEDDKYSCSDRRKDDPHEPRKRDINRRDRLSQKKNRFVFAHPILDFYFPVSSSNFTWYK